MSDLVVGMKSARNTVSGITAGMQHLGMLSDDTLKYMNIASGGLQVITGATGMIKTAIALKEILSAKETAEATVKTTALSVTGVGLGRIALALGTVAVASVGMYELLDKVVFADVNNSADRGRINALVGVI